MADYVIRVDRRQLIATADAVEKYVTYMQLRKQIADGEIAHLSWRGDDAVAFRNKWNTLANVSSRYSQMISRLRSVASYLRTAESQYRNAQSRAISRANWLR